MTDILVSILVFIVLFIYMIAGISANSEDAYNAIFKRFLKNKKKEKE